MVAFLWQPQDSSRPRRHSPNRPRSTAKPRWQGGMPPKATTRGGCTFALVACLSAMLLLVPPGLLLCFAMSAPGSSLLASLQPTQFGHSWFPSDQAWDTSDAETSTLDTLLSPSAKPLTKPQGYPTWEQALSTVAHAMDGTVAYQQQSKEYCEAFWGNGYKQLSIVFGTPPDGVYHEAEDIMVRERASMRPQPRRSLSKRELDATQKQRQEQQRGRNVLVDSPDTSEEQRLQDWMTSSKQQRDRHPSFPNPSAEDSKKGWLRCFRNPTLGASICEGSMVGVYPGRIHMSQGGEELSAVPPMRSDTAEMPVFDAGALEVQVAAEEVRQGYTECQQDQEDRDRMWRLEVESGNRPTPHLNMAGDALSAYEMVQAAQNEPRIVLVAQLGNPMTEPAHGGVIVGVPGQQHGNVANPKPPLRPAMSDKSSPISRMRMEAILPKESTQSYQQKMWESLRAVPAIDCAKVVNIPTLFVMREDYANLYFAMMTWLNSFHATRVSGLNFRPQVVLLDGHAKSPLDNALSTLFAGHRFIKSYNVGDKAVCFRHAIFVPFERHSAVRKSCTLDFRCIPKDLSDRSRMNLGAMERLTEFAEFVVNSFGLKSSVDHWAPNRTHLLEVPGAHSSQQLGHVNNNNKPQGMSELPTTRHYKGRTPTNGSPGMAGLWADVKERERKAEEQAAARGRAREESRQDLGRPLRVLFIRRDPAHVHPRQRLPLKVNTRLRGQEELISGLHLWMSQGADPTVCSSGDEQATVPLDDGVSVEDSRSRSRKQKLKCKDLEEFVRRLERERGRESRAEEVDEGLRRFQNRQRLIEGHATWHAMQKPLWEKQTLGTSFEVRERADPRMRIDWWGTGRRAMQESEGEVHPGSALPRVPPWASNDPLAMPQGRPWEPSGSQAFGSPVGTSCYGGAVLLNATMVRWSLRQQLEAVQWADVIVGAHGAGLTHSLFSRPGTLVVEVRPRGVETNSMQSLAMLRGLKYQRVVSVEVFRQVKEIIGFLRGYSCK